MSSPRRVWIRSSVLQTCVNEEDQQKNNNRSSSTVKQSQLGKRSSRKPAVVGSTNNLMNAEFGWGWVFAELLAQNDEEVVIFVEDDDCIRCNGKRMAIPSRLVGDGNMLTANSYTNPNATDDDDDEKKLLPPNNLVNLTHLHEPAVVHCLRQRYAVDEVYTATGPILLAINPFKMIDGMYSDEKMDVYWESGGGSNSAGSGGGNNSTHLGPHVFANADNAFRKMMTALKMQQSVAGTTDSSGKKGRRSKGKKKASDSSLPSPDQSLLVSGESGAGKTVTTKFIMKYLATVSERMTVGGDVDKFSHMREVKKERFSVRMSQRVSQHAGGSLSSRLSMQRDVGNIEEKIVESNPILESFGNARTHRNDNSSRFGKFIEMRFTSRGTLIGAAVNTYLLEKIRLIDPSPGERNYHIFYQMIEGADPEDEEMFFLEDKEFDDFKFLSKSGTYDRRDGVDDMEDYDLLQNAFSTMGFGAEEETDILCVAAALLHAGNLGFKKLAGDQCTIDDDDDSSESFDAVLKLLQVEKEVFTDAVCHCNVKVGKETFKRNLNISDAQNGLESLIKATYNAMFNHLVKRINSLINSKTNLRSEQEQAAYIGVLDIFGFESFKINSFEQLCINYCNEALQQQFNRFVFKNEQEEYANEGIEWSNIEFPDNQDALDLIDMKSTGLLSLLDEACRVPGGSDKSFASDVYKKCSESSPQRFIATRSQIGLNKFSIVHYAGEVEYLITGFVEKNKDELPREATMLLSSSQRPLVKTIAMMLTLDTTAAASTNNTGGSKSSSRGSSMRQSSARQKKQMSVGGQFAQQLKELRDKIDSTSPHYIRCMKPNDELEPDNFNPVNISEQLTCAGVIEAVKVSRMGFPQRYAHELFLRHYGMLDPKWHQKKGGVSKQCQCLVEALSDMVTEGGAQMGKTKVFMKGEAFEMLERLRGERMQHAAIVIQSYLRGFVARVKLRIAYRAIIKLQNRYRIRMAMFVLSALRRNRMTTLITKNYRRFIARRCFIKTMVIARWLQRVHRGRVGRRRYDELNRIRKATIIETAWRLYYHNRYYMKMKQAVVVIQCVVRCRTAKQKLRQLRLEAKDLGAIKVERDRLRVEVEALRVALQNASSVQSDNMDAEEAKEGERKAREELELYKSEVQQLEVALDESQANNSEAEVKYKKIIEELSIAKEKAKEGERKATEELEQNKSKVQQLKVASDASRAIYSEIEVKYKEMLEELSIAKEEVKDARMAELAAQDALEQFKNEAKTLKSDLVNCEDSDAEQIENDEKENAEQIAAAESKAQGEIAGYQLTIEELNQALEKSQALLSDGVAKYDKLLDDNALMVTKVDELTQERDVLQKKLEACKQKQLDEQKQINEVSSTAVTDAGVVAVVVDDDNGNARLENELITTQEELAASKEVVMDIQNQMERYKSEVETLKEQLNEKQAQIQSSEQPYTMNSHTTTAVANGGSGSGGPLIVDEENAKLRIELEQCRNKINELMSDSMEKADYDSSQHLLQSKPKGDKNNADTASSSSIDHSITIDMYNKTLDDLGRVTHDVMVARETETKLQNELEQSKNEVDRLTVALLEARRREGTDSSLPSIHEMQPPPEKTHHDDRIMTGQNNSNEDYSNKKNTNTETNRNTATTTTTTTTTISTDDNSNNNNNGPTTSTDPDMEGYLKKLCELTEALQTAPHVTEQFRDQIAKASIELQRQKQQQQLGESLSDITEPSAQADTVTTSSNGRRGSATEPRPRRRRRRYSRRNDDSDEEFMSASSRQLPRSASVGDRISHSIRTAWCS